MKLYFKIAIAVLALLGWAAAWYLNKKPPVESVVYKDRVVTRDVVRTETRPDGTKIVIESKTATKEVSKPVAPKAKNAIGVSVQPVAIYPKWDAVYRVDVARRIGQSPVWVTGSVDSKKEWTLGLRIDL